MPGVGSAHLRVPGKRRLAISPPISQVKVVLNLPPHSTHPSSPPPRRVVRPPRRAPPPPQPAAVVGMYPIADLTAFCRRTTGDVPPKLVGASTTVVGSKMYLYGGRLVAERRMVSDIYIFDLETFVWEKLAQPQEDDVPQPRYFHSADAWNNHLIIFGGMAIQPRSDNPEDLCVLNDVRLFDLSTYRWVPAAATSNDSSPGAFIPNARYAHLSSVTSNRLFVIGGQDLNNVWLDDIHVYDMVKRVWVQRREYPRHCGTYRSVAVTADMRVRIPQEEGRNPQSAKLGPAGTRFKTDKNAPPSTDVTSPDSLIHLPYSAAPTDEHPCDIYLFSNYNFTDVQRELEVFTPGPDGDFTITDRSGAMTGTSFPPGLRFPIGAILGTHFIIAGTYLSQTFQSFSVWTLDLVSMVWSRIDPGSALVGSWFRSCLWPEANKFLIFGNRHGNLVEDYNRRLLSWDHVAVIDLEAFGIYRPPPLLLDIPMQEMGLAALEEGVFADFEIICDDGRKIPCSRKLLEERWPWFKEQRKLFIQAATRAMEASTAAPLPELSTADQQEPRPDPRLTPRSFQLSEPYPITLALLQYLYSTSLLTPLQHAPAVLSQLLLLSSTYDMPHLQSLVKHAMHRALTFATSVGIYGVSTLCNCRSLQIRALRVVMAYSQKRPAGGRAREKDAPNGSGGGGGRSHNSGTDGSGRGGGSSDRPSAARPRGMSDASYLRGPGDSAGGVAGPRGTGFSSGNINLQRDLKERERERERSRTMTESPVIRHHRSSEGLNVKDNSDPLISLIDTAADSSSAVPSPETVHKKELEAIAEMMATSVNQDDPIVELHEALESSNVVMDDTDSIVDNYLPDDTYELDLSRFSLQSHDTTTSGSSFTAPALTIDSSLSPDSDFDPADDYCDSALLSPRSPFPTFHLPRTSPQPGWESDSSLRSSVSYTSLSTPSLSRASSFQHAATAPASPIPPSADPPSSLPQQGLGVIQERHSEDSEDFPLPIMDLDGRTSRGSFYDRKESFDVDVELVQHRTLRASHVIWERRQHPELERLRIETVTPDTITPDRRGHLSPDSPATSTSDSSIRASARSPGGTAISRLFSKTPKGPKSPRFTKSLEALHSSSNLTTADLRAAAKAEEKARKKELAKLRKERLAKEAEEKARKEAAEDMRRRKIKVGGDEMFGGMHLGYLQGL
ncbi:hypothetical protein EIP91_002878 [Steccherinum ochraceum]|uniref:BTB domain-containing protein n=1 Tax=Steccherinum ochraceum TaxID=92696 RepID=A0A4R0RTH0_9APHY|nr:hypothetical protein EIP91_002878 [Steccherinum ochraceum]